MTHVTWRRRLLLAVAAVVVVVGGWIAAHAQAAADVSPAAGVQLAAAPVVAGHQHGPDRSPPSDGQDLPDADDDGGQGEEGDDAPGEADGGQQANGCAQSGLPPHDGEQEGQRCVATAVGELPDPEDIPAVRITSPEDGATLAVGEPFQVVAAIEDLTTGHFNDPQEEYFAEPQQLDEDGQVLGHAHVVVQRLPQDGEDAPGATAVSFFQGLDEAAEGGQLGATAPGLEEPGVYRVQVNTASSGHQAIISPVARHFAPVDVIRIQVQQPDADGETDAPQEEGGQQEATAQPVTVAAQAPPPGGDGIPPAPRSTRPDAGGGGGGPAAGGGGAGDGQPPPPVTSAPAASAPAEQPPSGYAQPVAAERGINAWVVGGGLLVFVGAAVVALTRLRRRRPRGRPARAGYQGRHLDDDDGGDGQGQPAAAAEADVAAAALSGELGRLNLQQSADAANRPERG